MEGMNLLRNPGARTTSMKTSPENASGPTGLFNRTDEMVMHVTQ